jgi:hypothetical protein
MIVACGVSGGCSRARRATDSQEAEALLRRAFFKVEGRVTKMKVRRKQGARAMSDVAAIGALVDSIKPYLADKPAMMQGAALAELLAIWLAGQMIENDPQATHELREKILQAHLEKVRELIPINARLLGAPP